MQVRLAVAAACLLAFVAAGCETVLSSLEEAGVGGGRPAWARDLVGQLACDGAVAPLGAAGGGPDDVSGGAAAATIEESAALFVRHEAAISAFLPLGGWEPLQRADHWGLYGHVVDGKPKAVALFSEERPEDDPAAAERQWFLWNVAACDAAEFDPTVEVPYGLVVWEDETGRVPTTLIHEMDVCAERHLRVEERLFVKDPGLHLGAVLLDSWSADVPLPADARPTRYRSRERRLWLAADESAAYVETAGRAEQWPRVRGDEIPRADCN